MINDNDNDNELYYFIDGVIVVVKYNVCNVSVAKVYRLVLQQNI